MWIKVTSGSFMNFVPVSAIVRMIVSTSGTMTIYTNSTNITNFPVTDWNNGRLLDENFVDTGTNPLQV